MAEIIARYDKHPSAKRFYPIDVLNLGSNTIGSPTASVSPSGPTIDTLTVDGGRVLVPISGGTNGTNYLVTVLIPISNGEILVVEFRVQVRATTP